LRSGNSSAGDKRLAVVEHDCLTRRRRPEWIVQLERCSTATKSRHRTLRQGATVPDARQPLHLRALSDEPHWSCGIDEWNAAHVQRCAWRNGDPIRHRVYRADIARCNTAPRETPALPNREPFASGVRADNGARFVNDLALAACGTTFTKQAAVITVGYEADLLALWLLCSHKATRSCDFPHLRFRHAAQRESRPRDCSAVESMQEVGLVFLDVYGGAESPREPVIRDSATRIVPRSNRVTTEERAPLANEGAEFHRGVAAHARARRLTALIRRHKWFQDRIGELLLKVLNVERNAKMIGDATRIVSGIEGAAALAMAITLIGGAMQSHPHADNLVARLN
jgi:hypothetical protein